METLDLTKILKDCPQGAKFYSTIHGEVEFVGIESNEAYIYPIEMRDCEGSIVAFTSDGRWYDENGECILFPSKENRDWNTFKIHKKKFDISTLKPFDKVLVRDGKEYKWKTGIYSHYNDNKDTVYRFVVSVNVFKCCIPYNDDTKELVGTKDEAPEFYITWE